MASEVSITQLLDSQFYENARKVFEWWVGVENDNLTRVHAKLLKCRMPSSYRTNETWFGGWIELWLQFPSEEQFEQTTCRLKESLEWVGLQLLRRDDLRGAAKAAQLHHHLLPKDHGGPFSHVHFNLNERLGRTSYVYAGVDRLGEVVQAALEGRPANDLQSPTNKA
jgi:hypothetical protein